MKYDLTSFEVAPYSHDFITHVIRHVTNWDSRSEILDKAHVAYLNNYLTHLKVKTVIFESSYIDRHYLEDYSEYYARCFQTLPKTCARIHFFTTEFNEEDFARCINSEDSEFIKSSITNEGAYVGFVVLRPLPVTCIARMCLAPYDIDNSIILKNDVKVSLFGIELEIKTAAFIEQDKVLSACATSAIWALLNANETFKSELLPSPSAITKSASNSEISGTRVFPAVAGLDVDQVCRSLKAYGLEPTVIDKQDYSDANFMDTVRSVLCAYLPSKIPVLIGGSVIQNLDAQKSETLGEHLVCALGYKVTSSTALSVPEDITRIYVHDDRYGPYVSLCEDAVQKDKFSFKLTQRFGTEDVRIVRDELFEPKVLIVGLYHKIRIDFDYAYNVAGALFEIANHYVNASKPNPDKRYQFEAFANCSIQVSLCYSAELKADLIKNLPNFFVFNGTDEASAFFTANLPKYVWRCRYVSKQGRFADILLDATGIPQGDLVLGCLAYSQEADEFWRVMAKLVKEPFYKDITTTIDQNYGGITSCITRFFINFERNDLEAYYGPVRLPVRKYRESEIDKNHNQITRSGTKKIVRGNRADSWMVGLNKETVHIWVIDQEGDLIAGDEPISAANKQGHPSLTGGGTARLGGELIYCKRDSKWEINALSGTYSAHLISNREKRERYLTSVKEVNLSGCDVRIQQEDAKCPIRADKNKVQNSLPCNCKSDCSLFVFPQ